RIWSSAASPCGSASGCPAGQRAPPRPEVGASPMWRWLRRLLITLCAVVAIVVLIPVVGLGYGFLTTSGPQLARPADIPVAGPAARPHDLPGYKRTEESTFLTYPEWAIVYAAREYAQFVSGRFPSRFPYWAYAGRFWQDYALMIRAS